MMTPNTPFTSFTPLTPTGPFISEKPESRGLTPSSPAAAFVPAPPPLPESTSLTLARAAAAGDTRAMSNLLRELGPRIERVVRAILGRAHQDADDVIQQAMLGVVQSLASFRGECEPIYFASRVAARTAVAAARKRRALHARHEDGVDVDQLVSSPSRAPQPLADAERSRRMTALRDALSRIPAEQAEALALRIVLGWSLADVAAATGVPLNTVRSRLRLAKTALRTLIDDDPIAREELDQRDDPSSSS